MATVLVVGATGNTGRPLVEQLLRKNHQVRAIVRSPEKLPSEVLQNNALTVIEASVLDLTDAEMAKYVQGCNAVVSCLGHVLNFKGMYGQPRKLCTDATRRLCEAIEKNNPPEPAKFILMNTVGVRNPDLAEKRSCIERGLMVFYRQVLPPAMDNETAAAHLREMVGKGKNQIEWCSVRPDSLIDADVSQYEIKKSPVTSIFSGRPTTRSNVAHFMIELIENAELWATWKFQMPVIMNSDSGG